MLGISRLATDAVQALDQQPFIDEHQQVAVVADCRLDERDTLCATLSLAPRASDGELLVAAYRRWGEGFAGRIAGDFAGVVWDWRAQRCLLFRDPLGVKPLFYARHSGGVAVASDTELVVGLAEPQRVPDDQMVVEYLLWEYASANRTFWAAVSRLPGGHVLAAGPAEGKPPERYWRPGASKTRFGTRAQVHDELRHAFLRSVERRLQARGPVLSHLSGGIDSSLIVCAAAHLRRNGRGVGAQLATVSERFPGTGWDEGEFIEAVRASTGVEGSDWDGRTTEFVDLTRPSLAGPGMRVYRASGSAGDLEIAAQRSVRVMLSGTGGDQVGRSGGLEGDRIRRRPLAFAFETVTRGDLSWAVRRARMRALAQQFAPISLRRAVGAVRYRRQLPAWLEPAWRSLARDIAATFYPDELGRSFEYRIHRARWQELTSGRMGRSLDLHQCVGARYGVEFRFPYLDRDLVELVLSVPPEHWPDSDAGRIQRDALGDLLPPKIRDRDNKAIFSGAVGQRLKNAADRVKDLFHSGEWHSARFVRRPEAQALLDRALAGAHWRDWHAVRAIASLEAWLRAVLGYSSAPGG